MTTNLSPNQGLRIHAFVFAAVIAINVVINIMTGPPWWVQWVFFPWIIGLVAHWYFTRGAGTATKT